jgi:hypothetical protein
MKNYHFWFWLLNFSNGIFPFVPRLPTFSSRHRTSFRYEKSFPAAQGFSAEVPAGSRAGFIDRTAPLLCSAGIKLLFAKVPAGGICKEIAAFFLEPALAEIMQLMGFALPDKDNGEPAAAFAAAVAGTGCHDRLRFHSSSSLYRTDTKREGIKQVTMQFFACPHMSTPLI